jgi:hypothetical protein
MSTGIIFYFVPQRRQWRGDKLGEGADRWVSRLHELTCLEASSWATFAWCPCRTRVRPNVLQLHCTGVGTTVAKPRFIKPRYHSSAVLGVLLSCQHNVASKEIRTDDQPRSIKFRATQRLCDVEEGRRRRSSELPVARSGNCLCCYNPTRQRVSLFVRTGLITSLWFKIYKDRYERSHHLPYRHPEAVQVCMDRKDMNC